VPYPQEAFESLETLAGAVQQATLLDRTDEGRQVAEQLLAVRGQIAVLHGREGSGKTEFVRSCVIPTLPRGCAAYYGRCSPELPDTLESANGPSSLSEAARSDGFIFLDSFDRLLSGGIASRRQTLAPLLSERKATLVLIVSDQRMGELLALRSIVPGIMDHLIESGQMSLSEGLEHVEAAAGGARIVYSAELVAAIEADLETFNPWRRALTPELVVLIDSYFRSVTGSAAGNLSGRSFKDVGALRGVLDTDLNRRLALAPPEMQTDEGALLRAVLEELVESRAVRREFDTAEPARRLGRDPAASVAALAWLKEQSIVRQGAPGTFEMAPIHREQVIAENLEQKRRNTRGVREALARGLASWKEMHVVLPPDRTAAIHAVRAGLAVTDDEASFMVQCSMRCGETGNEWAKYWLGRIPRREQQIAVAFEVLFDADPTIRARAAALLAGYDEPEVRGQLYRTSVEDPVEEVRHQAITALSGMQVAEYWEPLARDARLPSSRYREAAVEALRLFPDSRTVNLLKNLVSDPSTAGGIRAKAIQTMGQMDCAEAAEALVDITLRDGDEGDRNNAAEALGVVKTRPVAAAALDALRRTDAGSVRWISHGGWGIVKWTCAVPLAALVGLANAIFHGAALIAIRRYRTGIAILAAETAILTALIAGWGIPWLGLLWVVTLLVGTWIPVKLLIERRSRLQTALDTFPGLLALVLYAGSVFTLFFLIHGLAHLFAGRLRTAVRIIGLQLLAIACFGIYYIDQQTYGLTRVGPLYLYAAVALWFATWMWDVIPVALDQLVAPERAIFRQRHRQADARLLSNPMAAGCLLELADSSDAKDRTWARSVFRECGSSVPPLLWVNVLRTRGAKTPRFIDRALRNALREESIRELQTLWSDAAQSTRERIFRILAWNPSERSLECLGRMREHLSFAYRLRYYLAVAHFRLKLVPGMIWIAALMASPMAVSLAYHGWQYASQPSRLARNFVNSRAAQDKDPGRVVKFAKFVADAYPDTVDSALVTGLGRILGGTAAAGLPGPFLAEVDKSRWDSGIQAARQLADLTRSPVSKIAVLARRQLENNLPALKQSLSSAELDWPWDAANRRKVLATLEAMANPSAGPLDSKTTSDAVNALQDFAMRGDAGGSADRTDSRRLTAGNSGQTALQGLQIEAVRSLGRIPSMEASGALDELALKTGPPVQWEAQNQKRQMGVVLVDGVRGAYERSDYARAIETGTRVLSVFQLPEDSNSRADLLELIGKAKWHLASGANADQKQVDQWYRGAVSNIEESGRVRNRLDPDARRVLASCYASLAERLIPGDLDQALQMAGKALQADSTYAQGYGTQALVLWNRKNPEGAIGALDQAVRLEPRYAWAYGMKAWIHLQQGKYADALKYSEDAIDADNRDSWGYSLLREAYHGDGKDREAIAALDRLRQKFPDNPWPLQTQIYAYHEDLSATDHAAYQQTYALYLELQKPQYLSQITNSDDLEAGFVEANLTVARYAEAVERGGKLLDRTKQQPDLRLTIPVRLIVYAALALKGDTAKAAVALGAFESALTKLPRDYKSEWSYKGTLLFIRAGNAAEPMKTRLADLVQAVDKDPAHVPPAVLQANREAVKRKWFF
jgi:hypothetical protein